MSQFRKGGTLNKKPKISLQQAVNIIIHTLILACLLIYKPPHLISEILDIIPLTDLPYVRNIDEDYRIADSKKVKSSVQYHQRTLSNMYWLPLHFL